MSVALPAEIRLGTAAYTVETTSKGLLGRTKNGPMRIQINTNQADDSIRDTLLHETLHALLYISGAAHVEKLGHDGEERLVRLLTPWLLLLLRDNPDLLGALLLDSEDETESEATL